MKKEAPKDGQLRAAGTGPFGTHHGKPVWDLKAAQDRKQQLAVHCSKTWIEKFQKGSWEKLKDSPAN